MSEMVSDRLSGDKVTLVAANNISDNAVSASHNPFPVYIASGFIFFVVVNYLTRFAVPEGISKNAQSRWKWRNVLTSFIHSFITGAWAPYAFYDDPSLGNDMIRGFNTSIHVLVSFSVGYFVYDFFDMFIYHKKRSTYELLVHHFMVILCYTIAVSTQTYVSYAALSLVVEINSVFLHARQLFIIGGVGKHRIVYRVNSLLNVVTFLLFRILLLGWMSRWLTLHRDVVPLTFFSVGLLGLATIIVMNIVLLYRVLMGDYLKGNKLIVNGHAGNSSPEVSKLDKMNGKNGYHKIDSRIVQSYSSDDSKKFQ